MAYRHNVSEDDNTEDVLENYTFDLSLGEENASS